MWNNYKYLFLLLILFGISCCNTNEPPSDVQGINLKLEDASCTEAWIELTTTNLQLPTTITLKQNGATRETINLIGADSLLYIDSLLPNKSYQYQASSIPQRGRQYPATSLALQLLIQPATTLHLRRGHLVNIAAV